MKLNMSNVFLKVGIPEDLERTIIEILGTLVDMLVETDPDAYKFYVTCDYCTLALLNRHAA